MNQIARRAGWRRGKKTDVRKLTQERVEVIMLEALSVFNPANAAQYVEGVQGGAAYVAAGSPDALWQDYYTGKLGWSNNDDEWPTTKP